MEKKDFVFKIATPRIPKRLKEAGSWEEVADVSSEELEGYSFRSCSFSSVSEAHYSVQACRFMNCSFPESSFKKSQFCDVVFVNCDLSNVNWAECSFCRVEFIECKLMGANLQGGTFTHVSFVGNQGRYLVASMSKWNTVQFLSNQFQGAAFDNCTLNKVIFESCNLTETEFHQTSLRGIDLRSSEIIGIRLTGPELRQTIVTSMQAAWLARLLGVVVKD